MADGEPEDWPSQPEQLRCLDRSLRCAVCYDLYTGPVVLPCSHSCERRAPPRISRCSDARVVAPDHILLLLLSSRLPLLLQSAHVVSETPSTCVSRTVKRLCAPPAASPVTRPTCGPPHTCARRQQPGRRCAACCCHTTCRHCSHKHNTSSKHSNNSHHSCSSNSSSRLPILPAAEGSSSPRASAPAQQQQQSTQQQEASGD